MAKHSGGTKIEDKTHSHVSGKESPVLFRSSDPDNWYDWDGKEAIDYIEKITDGEVEGRDARDALHAIRMFVDSDQHEIREAQRGNESYAEDDAASLDMFLANAPKYTGTTYRGIGMSQSEFDKLKEGQNYGREGSQSWTTKMEVARNYDYNPEGNEVKVVLRCQKQNAVSVRFAAKYPEEHEVISESTNKYKIKKISPRQKWGGYIIDVVSK